MRRTLPLAFAVALTLIPAIRCPAADLDPAVKARLDALVAAYKALPAYVDQGAVEIEMKLGGVSQTRKTETPVTVVRPNKLRIKTPLVEIVSDGKNLLTSVPAVRRYFKSAAPSKITHNDLTEGPLGSFERGGPLGMPMRVLLTLLLDENPTAALMRDATGVSIEKDQKIGEVTYSGLRIESDVAPSLVLWIDPKSKLVAQIDVKMAERVTPDSAVPGVDVVFGSFRWTSGTISTQPSVVVEVKPEAEFKEVVGLDATETEKSEHQLVGKNSPEFTLNLLESGGKTRRATLKELEGKVVLIDFWATWCAPCRKEMPDIAKLSEEFAKANKPVVVVALSIDQPEDADLAALEKKVRADIKSLGFDVEKTPTSLLALDPSGTTARSFGVSAIPTLVLLDAKGIVRAVHVGLTERDILAEQVNALLEGKALLKR